MEITEEQKNSLRELIKTYPSKDQFRKLVADTEFFKKGCNFVTIINPFLIYAENKNSNLADLIKPILEKEDIKELMRYVTSQLSSTGCFGESRRKDLISKLVLNNLETIILLENLILECLGQEKQAFEDEKSLRIKDDK